MLGELGGEGGQGEILIRKINFYLKKKNNTILNRNSLTQGPLTVDVLVPVVSFSDLFTAFVK